jgi:hypothetical protein
MAWRFKGRARVSASNPQAFAVCDDCGIWYNHVDLRWQMQWSGTKLQNLRLLVCERCWDDPQPQLKARILPPDPLPIRNPRPEYFYIDENTFLYTNDGLQFETNDGLDLVTN